VRNPGVLGPHMLRKFPPQMAMRSTMGVEMLDKNARRDFYGERLFTKISSMPQYVPYADLFSKIVGIFLDLDDGVIARLIEDDNYFNVQAIETIRVIHI
jgi:hypothetical protein